MPATGKTFEMEAMYMVRINNEEFARTTSAGLRPKFENTIEQLSSNDAILPGDVIAFPIDVDPPYWLGLWFGVYPTWETIGAQVAAMIFVIGSYVLAREVRVRGPRRRASRAPGEGAAWGSHAGVGVESNGHQHPNGGEQREGDEDAAGAREATKSPAR